MGTFESVLKHLLATLQAATYDETTKEFKYETDDDNAEVFDEDEADDESDPVQPTIEWSVKLEELRLGGVSLVVVDGIVMIPDPELVEAQITRDARDWN